MASGSVTRSSRPAGRATNITLPIRSTMSPIFWSPEPMSSARTSARAGMRPVLGVPVSETSGATARPSSGSLKWMAT
jgi:hypothetical protein